MYTFTEFYYIKKRLEFIESQAATKTYDQSKTGSIGRMLDAWFRKTGTPALLPSSYGSDLVPYGNCPAMVSFSKDPEVKEKMQYYLSKSAAIRYKPI